MNSGAVAGRGLAFCGANQFSLSRKATTWPIMMMVGPRRFAALAFAAMSAMQPVTVFLRRARSILDNRYRQTGIGAACDELRRQRFKMRQPHIDRHRLARTQQRFSNRAQSARPCRGR